MKKCFLVATLFFIFLLSPIVSVADSVMTTISGVGSAPYSSTLVGTKLYVNNSDSNNVSVIDTTTNTVTATIAVDSRPYVSTLVDTKLYVINQSSSTVSVIDTTTNTVTATILVGGGPQSLTLVGTKLYVINYSSNNVSVIDTTTNTVTTTVTVLTHPILSTLVGTKLYVNNYGSNSISVIDTTTNTVATTIPVGTNPQSSTLVGTKLYVINYTSNNISVIDTTTNTVTATTTVGSRPYLATLVGTKLYVINYNSSSVSVINTTTNTVVDTITVGTTPWSSVLIGTKLYVNNNGSSSVSVIDTTTNTVTATIDTGDSPYYSTVVGLRVYVNNSDSDSITVIDSGLTVPIITSATTSVTSSTTATVTWNTDILASSQVVYSADNSYGLSTSETDTSPRVTSHSVSLSSLVPCTTYTMKVVSFSAQQIPATSSAQSFTTTGCIDGSVASVATSTSVSSSATGTTTLTDAVSNTTITVNTPSGFTATSSNVVIQIRAVNSDTAIAVVGLPVVSGLQSIGDVVFDIKALIDNQTILDSFDIPVTITYTYTDADVLGFVESTIQMYHYHNGAWLPLDSCVVNTTTNTIVCTAPSFSIFGLFGTLTPSPAVSSGGGPVYGGGSPSTDFVLTTPVSVSTSTYIFTRNLSKNNIHKEVKTLQQFLNTHGFIVATVGAGSPGKETTKFGPATRAALIRFQKVYKIVPAVGFFGPVTRGVVSSLK